MVIVYYNIYGTLYKKNFKLLIGMIIIKLIDKI